MPNRGCAILEYLDDSKYSAPMPLIGLYIAAGSLVCLFAMLFDILLVFRHKRVWLPCQLFSLDSVTLSLLAIAAKLPVDLTTSMPSNLDQFSKLSGMAFICICMGFVMPSLGKYQKSESMSNMIALSILVVTVIVNICIQIRTGVILLFITEHIIIICCMLVLLFELWTYSVKLTPYKDFALHTHKDLIRTRGQGSMLERLKVVYLHSYEANPQFILRTMNEFRVVSSICMVCSVVLIQAAFRKLGLHFCKGKSAYEWSMWVIVLVQITTVVVGCVAIGFRFIVMSVKMPRRETWFGALMSDISRCAELLSSSKVWYKIVFLAAVRFGTLLLTFLVYLPVLVMMKATKFLGALCLKHKHKNVEDIRKYKHVLVLGLEKCVLLEGVKDMKRWIELEKRQSPNHLIRLLRETVPSEEPHSMLLVNVDVTPLSLVVLARIAQISLPDEEVFQSLLQVYDEACELLNFIADRTESKSLERVKATKIAKAVRRGDAFNYHLSATFDGLADHEPTPLGRSLSIIATMNKGELWDEFRELFPRPADWLTTLEFRGEVHLLADIILSRSYSSIEDLSTEIQQMFCAILHRNLAKLPHAIYKELVESTPEVFHRNVRHSLGILCKLEELQQSIVWSFPVESDLSQVWPVEDNGEPGEESPEGLV